MSIFETPDIASTIEFISSGFLQNNCSKQRLKLPGRCVKVLEKDFTKDVFVIRNLGRQKQKLFKKKIFFSNADADADVNADGNAEMPIPRFLNGSFKYIPLCICFLNKRLEQCPFLKHSKKFLIKSLQMTDIQILSFL